MDQNSSFSYGSLIHQSGFLGKWRGPAISPKSILAVMVIATHAMLLSSCASMSEVDCYYTDWYAKGLVDGANGSTMERFNRYVKDCSRHGVTPDRTDYIDGREEGLESYCTQSHGYEMGRHGRYYNYVCPSSLEADFFSGYNPGKRLHDAENSVVSINSSIAALVRTNEVLEREIEKFEDELLDPDTEEETRATRLRQIKRRQSEITQNELKVREFYEHKVEAIVTYRQVVREVRDLGFSVVEKY